MNETEHDQRRRLGLFTKQEVCDLAGCSLGCFRYHYHNGQIERPAKLVNSNFYYTKEQAERIAEHFRNRRPWERCPKQDKPAGRGTFGTSLPSSGRSMI